jgi:hypothetical protein
VGHVWVAELDPQFASRPSRSVLTRSTRARSVIESIASIALRTKLSMIFCNWTGALLMLLRVGSEPNLELPHHRLQAGHFGDRIEQRS